jgi:ribA/ribD-fused uncharacterized protein
MLLVNIFGPPGAGKSTGAAYIFSKLKMAGINAELVTEFAKDKVWEESKEVFRNQAYIFGKQFFRISRCENKVDVIVTDSPLFLSVFYNTDERLGESFNNMVLDVCDSYDSLNYLLLRNKPYNPKGRFQTEEESDKLGIELKEKLSEYGIGYKALYGDENGYDKIVSDVLNTLHKDYAKEKIDLFDGEYAFLSNFYPSEIEYEYMKYLTVEHAFQAAKTDNLTDRFLIAESATPGKAKRLGRKVELVENWEEIKDGVMEECLRLKFSKDKHPDLVEKLKATKDKILIEGNTWHDNYWGNCTCPECKNVEGKNKLGELLMKIRGEL